MRTTLIERTLLIGVLALTAAPAWAADLPAWTDDSGVVLSADPERFDPAKGAVVLTGRVFHSIDASALVGWRMVVQDASGREIRALTGDGLFGPGQPIELESIWDGRDATGAVVANGLYRVVLEIDMTTEGTTPSAPAAEGADHPSRRVSRIQQTTAGSITVAPTTPTAAAAPPNEPGFPYNFYFGALHTQTSYTDGGHPNDAGCASSTIHGGSDFDPAQAYSYARNTAHLDFLGITDHNHLFNDACSGCGAAQVVQRYHDGLSAATAANVDGGFVAMYGMEWGYISNPDAGFPNEGHIGLHETPKLFGWEPTGCTTNCYWEVFTDASAANYKAMYTKALQNPSAWGAFGQFMHPSDGTKSAAGQGVDFNSFEYTTDGDDLIHTIAVISGPATGFSTTATDTGALYAGEPVNGAEYAAYTSHDMYNWALGKGFHVAPVADPDVHCANYGTSTRDRTVILATQLTKAALFDAIHNRRVYATSDSNAQFVFTMVAGATTYYMGAGGIRTSGRVATSGSITLHTSVFDPEGATASSIKIKEPVPGNSDGSFNLIASGSGSPFDFTFTPPVGTHAYYVYVTLSNGNRMWSAPIWIDQGGTPDTAPPTTSITAPANGATVSGTASVTASASDNVGVTKVEFYLDSALQSTSATAPYAWNWNTTTTTNGSHTLTSKAYDAAGNVGTSAPVTVTVSNVADSTPPTAPTNLVATAMMAKGKIKLTWTASTDNVGVAGYEVWRASSAAGPFAQIATATTTAYTNGGLASGSTWYYYVTASDAAGNVSPASNTSSATSR